MTLTYFTSTSWLDTCLIEKKMFRPLLLQCLSSSSSSNIFYMVFIAYHAASYSYSVLTLIQLSQVVRFNLILNVAL